LDSREVLWAIGLIAFANAVIHRSSSSRVRHAAELGVTGAGLALARREGLGRGALGFGSDGVRSGAIWGASGALAVAGGIGAAVAARSEVMLDDRPAAMAPADARRYVLVRIPLETVVPEEVVFRGVLPALLARDGGPRWVPGIVSSLLFGLWHVLPFRALRRHNRSTSHVADRFGDVPTLAAHTAAMTAAGGVLYALRARSGSILAPALVHYAANALGFVGARWASLHWPRT
jgi:uncharacterized protein